MYNTENVKILNHICFEVCAEHFSEAENMEEIKTNADFHFVPVLYISPTWQLHINMMKIFISNLVLKNELKHEKRLNLLNLMQNLLFSVNLKVKQ